MRGINWKVTNRSQGGSILMIVCGALLALSPDSLIMRNPLDFCSLILRFGLKLRNL